jgi:hypothetical protein
MVGCESDSRMSIWDLTPYRDRTSVVILLIGSQLPLPLHRRLFPATMLACFSAAHHHYVRRPGLSFPHEALTGPWSACSPCHIPATPRPAPAGSSTEVVTPRY